MEQRRLGRTDTTVSAICLGTMTWGEQNTQDEAFEQMDYALDQGINFFDTAELYPVPPVGETQGRTEAYIGAWFQARQNRDRVVLASKVAGPTDWVPHIRGGTSRLDRPNIRQAVEDSLRRLQTDVIDLYQVHWPDRPTNYFGKLGYRAQPDDEAVVPIAQTLEALQELVDEGKVRHLGISNETPWGVAEYLRQAERRGWPPIVTVQNPYNLLNRTYEIGLAEFADRSHVGMLAYSPLGFGVLSGKYLDGQQPEGARLSKWTRFSRYTNPQATAATAEYVALARAHGLDPAQMALQYVTTRPFTTATIIGATTMAQLEANIASADIELSEEVLKGIEEIHTRQPNPAP